MTTGDYYRYFDLKVTETISKIYKYDNIIIN